MKVLYILDPIIVGGATRSFLEVVTQMREKSVDVVVVTGEKTELNNTLDQKGIVNICSPHTTLMQYKPKITGVHTLLFRLCGLKHYLKCEYESLQFLKQNIDFSKIDIIHTNSSRSSIGCRLSKAYNIPHIMHIREFGDLDYDCNSLIPYLSLYNNHTTRFICVSDAVRRHWANKGINANKMQTIYNGIHHTDIVPSDLSNINTSEFRMVISGSVMPTKQHHIIIEAMNRLPNAVRPHVHLDIIGWESNEYVCELKRKIEEYSIESQVSFLGVRKDIYKLLCKYHVGLMCSKSEGFGRVTAEFMFAQLGVLATDSGANPELIHEGETGLIFECGNPQSLADGISRLYNDRQLLSRLASNARKYAIEHFTDSLNAKNIYDIYKGFC